MKAVSLILVLVVALLLIGCPSQQVGSREPKEPLHGTWVNPRYPLPIGQEKFFRYTDKIVFTPDGEFKMAKMHNVAPYRITSKWTDSEGNAWYYVVITFAKFEHWGLIKVHSSNKTLEFFRGRSDWTKIGPERQYPYDIIYYHQK